MRNKFNMFDLKSDEELTQGMLNNWSKEIGSIFVDMDMDNSRTMTAIKNFSDYTEELYDRLFELGLDVISYGSYSVVAVCPWDNSKVIKVGINLKDGWLKWAKFCSTVVVDKTMLPVIHNIHYDKEVKFYIAVMDRYAITYLKFQDRNNIDYIPTTRQLHKLNQQYRELLRHLNKRGVTPEPTEEFLLSDKGEDTAYHFIYQDNMPFLNDLRHVNLMVDTNKMQLIITDPLS